MLELKLLEQFPVELIALDEVGRSPLSGPVVIGAVRVCAPDRKDLRSLLHSLRCRGVKDSKLLTPQQRQKVLRSLQVPALNFRQKGEIQLRGLFIEFLTWEMDQEVIDRENIYQAALRGMREAAQALGQGPSRTLLIDGPIKLKLEDWREFPIVKGDTKSALIGLASIIAKEARDEFMGRMHERWPMYGWESNKGYPTRAHREAIAKFGPSPLHRKSFKKVKEYL